MMRSKPCGLTTACLLGLILTSLFPSRAIGQDGILRGLVVEDANGEPLAAVNIALEAGDGRLSGATSTPDGYFLITGVEPGRYILHASFVSYETIRDTLFFEPGAQITVNLRMVESTVTLGQVVVTAEGAGQAVGAAGLQTITPKQIESVPMPDISGDLMAYLQTLPGVLSPGDRGGQLFIRGGTPSQNLILLDGMQLFQPFHIIGFFSAFPSDVIRSVDMYAGGFGAEYGGRLSSVIDVTTRNGNKRRYEGSASMGTFLTSVQLEGPLVEGKASFIGSIRESLFNDELPSTLTGDLPFKFGDEFLKVHTNLADGGQFSVSFINSHDRGSVDETESIKSDDLSDLLNVTTPTTLDEISWQSTAIGFRLVTLPEFAPIFGELTGSVTKFVNAFGRPVEPERRSEAFIIRASTSMAHQIGLSQVHWGASLKWVDLGYDLRGTFQNLDSAGDRFIGLQPYLEFDTKPTGNLRFTPGLHLFFVAGDQTVMKPEPRLRASWYPVGFAGGHELSAAVGIYHQNLVGLKDERDAGDVFTAWTFSEFGEGTPSALHAILGWRSQISAQVEIGVDGYYKEMTDLSVPAWSAFPRFTTTIESAEGDVYGVDARVSLDFAPLSLFVGYGYQWVEYLTSQESFAIWFGSAEEPYHPPHDRRHQVNVILGADLFGFADLDLRWEYGSGLPYTRPFGFDDWLFFETLPDVQTDPGEYRVSFERPYQGRLPTYHRLDLTLKSGFDLPHSRLTFQVGLFNAYDRDNLFYFDVWTLRRVDQMSIAPSFGIKLETR